jgi:hypothetical protein
MPTVAEDLDRMTKAQLRAEARLRGLPDGGTKDALLRRLRDDEDSDDDEFDDEPRDEDEEDFDDSEDEASDEGDEEYDDEPRDEDDEDDLDDEPRDEDDLDDEEEDDDEIDDEPRDEDDEDFEDDDVDEEDDEEFDDEPRDEDDEDIDEDDEDEELRAGSNGHARGDGLGELVGGARSSLEALTGKPVDAVSGIEPSDDGYRITLEVLEVQRVPATTDVLATYCVDVDDSGDITSFTKTSRYYRNQRLGD